jgi:hypothetical protein
MNRSPESAWRVAISFARTTGWRVGMTRIEVPRRMRLVAAAAYVSVTIGSSHGTP